jgi:hypothetical protein
VLLDVLVMALARMEDVMAKDSDFFTVTGPLNPKGDLAAIGGFSGAHSPLKTFGELIDSMREHGQHRAADQLHDGLIAGGATEEWIHNRQFRFSPAGAISLGDNVDLDEFHIFPRSE